MNRLDKRIFLTLFFSMFASITGVGIVVPLLPVYAHDLGASGLAIGMIYGGFALARTCFLAYFGRRSDAAGRKPYILTGLAGYTLISLGFLVTLDVPGLIVLRAIQGVASAMIMPVCQAYVGDITPEKREGFTMGSFNMSIFIGLAIGPTIGGVMKSTLGMDAAFLLMALLSGIAFCLGLFLLPPTRMERTAHRDRPATAWRHLLADPDILGIFVYRLVFSVCVSTLWGFLSVFATSQFHLSAAWTGILITSGVLASGVFQAPAGWLADRSDRQRMIVFGGAVVVASMFLFVRADQAWHLFGANLVFGMGGALGLAPLMAIAVEKGSRLGAMGAVMGVVTLGQSLGMGTGAILSGILMDRFELRGIFVGGAGVMVVGILVFLACSSRTRRVPA